MKNIKNIIIIMLAVLVIILGIYIIGLKKEISDIKEHIALKEGDSYTFMDEKVEKNIFLIKDNKRYISTEFIIKNIDKSIHYSGTKTRIYIPLENLEYELETKELTDFVKKNIVDINIPLIRIKGISYVDFDLIKKLYKIDVIYHEKGSFAIYKENDNKLRTYEGKTAIIIDEYKDLIKILTSDFMGYIDKKELSEYIKKEPLATLNTVRKEHDYGENIHISWHQITKYKASKYADKKEGVDIISPTWFSLNINGIIINEGDYSYVKDAKMKGYEVHPIFSNSFKPSWTNEMLRSPIYKKRFIAQMAFYSSLYDLDGINIDFENMYLKDKDYLTQFVAEAYPVLKEQNILVTMDVTIPEGSDRWSKVFDRKALSNHVDYMILMAYDEFWGSSKTAGPVSSIPWVEENIKKTLELVPSDKLLLGIPLYMRVWKMSKWKVSSKAIGIKHLEGVLKNKDYQEEYDEENHLNIIRYKKNNFNYKIWLEDEDSIEKRLELKRKYNLKGIGTWSFEFADDKTWEIIEEKLDV